MEELFKRSKAISEIQQKVILYKEFYKLLQMLEETDAEKAREIASQLDCSKHYERLTELHSQTINMWKMILYWRKRSEMAQEAPFLELDIDKITKAI